jgi:hypothetical protein
MVAPLVFPINARASGEKIEILRFFASASGSPTICQTRFSLVSSSITGCGAEFDGVAGELRYVDYFGTHKPCSEVPRCEPR